MGERRPGTLPYGAGKDLRPATAPRQFVALKPDPTLSFERLGGKIGLSASTLHRSVTRLIDAGLLTHQREVRRRDLRDLLLHGVRYVYYVKPGEPTRGVPTAFATSPLDKIVSAGDSIPVWPDPEGSARGYAVEPLDERVPEAARRDPGLYELLALVDAIRIGRPREHALAAQELSLRLTPTAGPERPHG